MAHILKNQNGLQKSRVSWGASSPPTQIIVKTSATWSFCYAHMRRNIAALWKKNEKFDHPITFQNLVFSRAIHNFKIYGQNMSFRPDFKDYLLKNWIPTFRSVYFPSGRHENRTTNSIEGFWRTCLELRQESWVVPFFAGFYRKSLEQIQKCPQSSLIMEFDTHSVGISYFGIEVEWVEQRRSFSLSSRTRQHKSYSSQSNWEKTGFNYTCALRANHARASPVLFSRFHAFIWNSSQDITICPRSLCLIQLISLKIGRKFYCTELPPLNLEFETLAGVNDFEPPIYGATRGRKPKAKVNTHTGVKKPRGSA